MVKLLVLNSGTLGRFIKNKTKRLLTLSGNRILTDQYWMYLALEQAQQALPLNEAPVGAVLVMNDELIAQANNAPISLCDPTAHAEVLVLGKAAQLMQNYRLPGLTLYVTLLLLSLSRSF